MKTIPNVLVGGTPRSGTSVVAGVLGRCGLDMGEKVREKQQEFDGDAVRNEDPVLGHVSLQFFALRDTTFLYADSCCGGMWMSPEVRAQLIEDKREPWVMKDPSGVTLFYPMWRNCYPGVALVAPIRHPGATAASSMKFFGIIKNRALRMWWRDNQALLTWKLLYPEDMILFVRFPEFEEDLAYAMKRLGLGDAERPVWDKTLVRNTPDAHPAEWGSLMTLYNRLCDMAANREE